MRRIARKTAPRSDPSDQRSLARKEVLFNGILVDIDGKQASDCIIRDINARGAAVSLAKTLPPGAQTILLDTGNRTAHFARVVWSNTARFELLFVRSYKMNSALPPRLVFLWRLLLEANLRQAERAVATGVPAELALTSIGVTREHILQTARYARTDTKLRQLLETAWCQLDEQPY